MDEDELLTPQQVAQRIGCGTRHLAKLVAARRIKYILVGLGTIRPRKRFDPADVEDLSTPDAGWPQRHR